MVVLITTLKVVFAFALIVGVAPFKTREPARTTEWREATSPTSAAPSKEESLGEILQKIVGGSDANEGEFPWMVSITVDKAGSCGGAVISEEWVITAAHCTIGHNKFHLIFGTIAPTDTSLNSVSRKSKKVITHKKYNIHKKKANDISLIQLDNPLSWSKAIRPVRLPSHSQAGVTFAGKHAVVSGWGRTHRPDLNSRPKVLKFSELVIFGNEDCKTLFHDIIHKSSICTAAGPAKGTAKGDSGGPLIFEEPDGQYTLIGIVSFGAQNNNYGHMNVYARVSSYLHWIEAHTGIAIRD